MKENNLVPQGKKIYKWEELSNLPISSDGVLQVDGIVMGPDEKWWIDEEGNAYFAGEMTVEKDVDPTYIQLDSTASEPSGTPPNSLWVQDNVLKFKNSSSANVIVPVGDSTGTVPTVIYNVNNNTTPGVAASGNVNAVTITPSSTASDIMIMAFWTGLDPTNAVVNRFIPTVNLKRGGTTLTTWSSASPGALGTPTHFGGAMFKVDSPVTTSATTYNLSMTRGGAETLLHSSLIAFECVAG